MLFGTRTERLKPINFAFFEMDDSFISKSNLKKCYKSYKNNHKTI